jgi:dihydrofolate reductase
VSKLVVLEYVSLDGVIQAPGHAGEDPSGGFAHGGWSGPFIGQHPHFVAESFAAADGFLFGRVTYEIFAAYWPTVTDPGDPVARTLNPCPSTSPRRRRWSPPGPAPPSWTATSPAGWPG